MIARSSSDRTGAGARAGLPEEIRLRDYVPRSSRKSPQEDRFVDEKEDGRARREGEGGHFASFQQSPNVCSTSEKTNVASATLQCAHDLKERSFCLMHLLARSLASLVRQGTTIHHRHNVAFLYEP